MKKKDYAKGFEEFDHMGSDIYDDNFRGASDVLSQGAGKIAPTNGLGFLLDKAAEGDLEAKVALFKDFRNETVYELRKDAITIQTRLPQALLELHEIELFNNCFFAEDHYNWQWENTSDLMMRAIELNRWNIAYNIMFANIKGGSLAESSEGWDDLNHIIDRSLVGRKPVNEDGVFRFLKMLPSRIKPGDSVEYAVVNVAIKAWVHGVDCLDAFTDMEVSANTLASATAELIDIDKTNAPFFRALSFAEASGIKEAFCQEFSYYLHSNEVALLSMNGSFQSDRYFGEELEKKFEDAKELRLAMPDLGINPKFEIWYQKWTGFVLRAKDPDYLKCVFKYKNFLVENGVLPEKNTYLDILAEDLQRDFLNKSMLYAANVGDMSRKRKIL